MPCSSVERKYSSCMKCPILLAKDSCRRIFLITHLLNLYFYDELFFTTYELGTMVVPLEISNRALLYVIFFIDELNLFWLNFND